MNGASSLSVAELLAILLRTGSSKESALTQAQGLVAKFDGLLGIYHASFAELCSVSGLGPAKVSQIKAALELAVRIQKEQGNERRLMKNPDDIADLMLADMSMLEQEQLRVVLLDTRMRMISCVTVYQGSVHTIHVRISELLSEAIRVKAHAFVLVHNHPSGDPTPSSADVAMTQQVAAAAKLMDIEFNDHIIMGGGRFVSMQVSRIGFPPKPAAPALQRAAE